MNDKNDLSEALKDVVKYAVSIGAKDCSSSLGMRSMPDGYALMQNEDGYYYWLRHDAAIGHISWDKWYCWRSAVLNAKAQITTTPA